MTRVDVVVKLTDRDPVTVGGYLVAPGLAIHRAVGKENEATEDWVVTHLKSGLRIAGSYRLKKDAERAGGEFAKLADWTRPMDDFATLGIGGKVKAIHERVLAESDGLKLSPEAEPIARDKEGFRETALLSGDPKRARTGLFLVDMEKMEREFRNRETDLLTTTQVDEISLRINKGLDWTAANRGKVSVAKLEHGMQLLKDLEAKRNRVKYENVLPRVVVERVRALLAETCAMGLKIPGAYVRVVIPEVLTFEADLVYEDIPF